MKKLILILALCFSSIAAHAAASKPVFTTVPTYGTAGKVTSPATPGSGTFTATPGGTAMGASSSVITYFADPVISSQPAPVSQTTNYLGTATFAASAQTISSRLTYAWHKNGTLLVNGSQPGGSTVSGAQGTSSATGSFATTLTVANVSYQDAGSYYLVATNAYNMTATSSNATLDIGTYDVVVNGASGQPVTSPSTSVTVVRAVSDVPLVGAIRWDGWQTDDDLYSGQLETNLGPLEWHYRCPFFTTINSPTHNPPVTFVCDKQSVMSQEINYAANAGISYWAFCIYSEQDNWNGLCNGLNLYLSNANNQEINFAMILGGSYIAGFTTNTWTNSEVPRYVNYFKMPNYQTVLGKRPLAYLGGKIEGNTTNFPSVASALWAINQLRAAATNAGVGNPYIVYQSWSAGSDYTTMQEYGLDALSCYALSGGTANGSPYTELETKDANFWASEQAKGANVVPNVGLGWDNRPFLVNDPTWYPDPTSNHYVMPTPAEIYDHLTKAMNWVTNNPSTCPANTVMIYAWNEHAEGGFCCPTLNTNDWVTPDSSRLDNGVAPAIASAYPAITLLNPSFETPAATNGGWYAVPSGGMPASFDWANNFAVGSDVIATKSAGRFSAAADGTQAILVPVNKYISQDTGPTSADTVYNLIFSILQDESTLNTNSILQAEIFDGANLLGSGSFTVPVTPNLWQTCLLTASSRALPAGDLIINFTTVAGTPWLDNVLLTVAVAPVTIIGYSPVAPEHMANGGNAVFTVAATGGGTLAYQWTGPCGVFSNASDPCGPAVVAGWNTSALTISGVGTNDSGSYHVTVSNSGSSANTSATPSVVTVVNPPQFATNPVTLNGSGVGQLNFIGASGSTYHLWGTTNVALTPVTGTWTLLGTGTLSGGADSFPIVTTNTYEFYTLTQP